MRVIAFYTKGTPYETEIQGLVESCKAFNIPVEIVGYEPRGSWVFNCGIKPEFVWDMLSKFPGERLLYLDADARVRKMPVLIDTIDADIAAYVQPGGVLLSGTVLFNNTEATRKLVEEWIRAQKNGPNKWDQLTLHTSIVNHGPRLGLNFKELPSEYTKIFDKPWGDPVIEHMQASRRFKNDMNVGMVPNVPSEIFKQRIRVWEDGSFTLPRAHKQAEEYMDAHYSRQSNELRWKRKAKPAKQLSELNSLFAGKKCYIVGKGPSLDNLTEDAFDDSTAPIICCNESVHTVVSLDLKNPIFAIQQDMGLHDTCRPKRGSIIVSEHAQHWYAEDLNKYVYKADDYKLVGSQLTAICAIEIAKRAGAVELHMLCFDACVTKETAYAKSVGYSAERGGKPDRFLTHRRHIDKHLTIKHYWVIPKSTVTRAKVPS